jgi:hypothetical protein
VLGILVESSLVDLTRSRGKRLLRAQYLVLFDARYPTISVARVSGALIDTDWSTLSMAAQLLFPDIGLLETEWVAEMWMAGG